MLRRGRAGVSAHVRHGGPGAGGRRYRVRPRGPFGPSRLPVTPGPSRCGSGHRLRPPQNRDQTGLRGPPRPRPTGRSVHRAGSCWARGLSGHPRPRWAPPPWSLPGPGPQLERSVVATAQTLAAALRPASASRHRASPAQTSGDRVGTGTDSSPRRCRPAWGRGGEGREERQAPQHLPAKCCPEERKFERTLLCESQPTCRPSGLREMNQVWDGNAKPPKQDNGRKRKVSRQISGRRRKTKTQLSRVPPLTCGFTRGHIGGSGEGRALAGTTQTRGRERRDAGGGAGAGPLTLTCDPLRARTKTQDEV